MVPVWETPCPRPAAPPGHDPGGGGRPGKRVSSADPQADLERPIQRREAFARQPGGTDFEGVAAVGSGRNGRGRKWLKILRDPQVGRMVVEHRDRLARFGFERVEAAGAAAGKPIVGVEEGEVWEDLVRAVREGLTSACGTLYGRRSARRRARKALEALRCG